MEREAAPYTALSHTGVRPSRRNDDDRGSEDGAGCLGEVGTSGEVRENEIRNAESVAQWDGR